jgi:hypothetical protein
MGRDLWTEEELQVLHNQWYNHKNLKSVAAVFANRIPSRSLASVRQKLQAEGLLEKKSMLLLLSQTLHFLH